MLPLHAKTFPATAGELAVLLNNSLRRLFVLQSDPVTVSGEDYPELERIGINLDHGVLRPNPPDPPEVKGAGTAALQVEELRIQATALAIGPAHADLRLRARDVRFDRSFDLQDEIVLLVQGAADGEIEISVRQSDLETAIATIARHEAEKQGVTIENVALVLNDRGPRGISGEVQMNVRKLFFSTVLRIAGNLDVDERLNATITGLGCKGDGAVGTLACGILSPHLQKLDRRTFPLMALPLGEIRLRDVRISTSDTITVKAEFGV